MLSATEEEQTSTEKPGTKIAFTKTKINYY